MTEQWVIKLTVRPIQIGFIKASCWRAFVIISVIPPFYDQNTTVTEMHWMARTLLKVPRSIYKILNESVGYSIVSNSYNKLF